MGPGHRMAAASAATLLAIGVAGCGSSPAQAGSTDDSGALDASGEAAVSVGTDGGADGPRGTSEAAADAPADAPALPSDASDASSGADVASDAARGDGGTTQSVYVTFYGWADNSPPGGAIAYPKNGGYPTLHNTAGGVGTYADPITFATDQAEIPAGTIVYVPFIEKYVMMEDDCVECDTDWTSSRKWHIDLWMNSSAAENATSLASCEGSWTRSATVVEIGAPPGRTVTTAPLFDPATNACRTTP